MSFIDENGNNILKEIVIGIAIILFILSSIAGYYTLIGKNPFAKKEEAIQIFIPVPPPPPIPPELIGKIDPSSFATSSFQSIPAEFTGKRKATDEEMRLIEEFKKSQGTTTKEI